MTREDAIYELKNAAWLGTDHSRARTEEAVDMAIKALEQEPCRYWQNGKCNGNTEVCEDAISIRKDALKTRVGNIVAYNVEWLKKHWQMEMDIVCGVKPCDDAISRADAQTEIMMFVGNEKNNDEIYIKVSDAVQLLRELPPVTPSRPKGHWIKESPFLLSVCSECGNNAFGHHAFDETRTDFCPNCGAEMVEPQESEV